MESAARPRDSLNMEDSSQPRDSRTLEGAARLRDARTPVAERLAHALGLLRSRTAVFPARSQCVLDWLADTAFRMCRPPRRSEGAAMLLVGPLFWTALDEAIVGEETHRPLYWSKPALPLVALALDCAAETRQPLPAAAARVFLRIAHSASDALHRATAQHARELLGALGRCGAAPGAAALAAAASLLVAWARSAGPLTKKAVEDLSPSALAAVHALQDALPASDRHALVLAFVVCLETTPGAQSFPAVASLLESQPHCVAADVFAALAEHLAAERRTACRAPVYSLFSILLARLCAPEPAAKRQKTNDSPKDECTAALAAALRALGGAGLAAVQNDALWSEACSALRGVAAHHTRSPDVLLALLNIDQALVVPELAAICSGASSDSNDLWDAFWTALIEATAEARSLAETVAAMCLHSTFAFEKHPQPFKTVLVSVLRRMVAQMRSAFVQHIIGIATSDMSPIAASNTALVLTAALLAAGDADRDALAAAILPSALAMAQACAKASQTDGSRPAALFLLDRAAQALVLAESRSPDAPGTLISDDVWRAIAKVARRTHDASLRALVHVAGRQDHEETLRFVPMAAVIDHAPALLHDPRIVGSEESSVGFWPAAFDEPLPAWALLSEHVLHACGHSMDVLVSRCLAGKASVPNCETAVSHSSAQLTPSVAAQALTLLVDNAGSDAAIARLVSTLDDTFADSKRLQHKIIASRLPSMSSDLLVATHKLRPESFACDKVRSAIVADLEAGGDRSVRWLGVLSTSEQLEYLLGPSFLSSAAWLERVVSASPQPCETAAALAVALERTGHSADALLSFWPRIAARARLHAALPYAVDGPRALAAYISGEMNSADFEALLGCCARPPTAHLGESFFSASHEAQRRTMHALRVIGDDATAIRILLESSQRKAAVSCCSPAHIAALFSGERDRASVLALLSCAAATPMSAGELAVVLQRAMRSHWEHLMAARPVLLALLARCIAGLSATGASADASKNGNDSHSASRADVPDDTADARRVARAVSDFARHRRGDQHMHAGAVLVAAAEAAATTSPDAQRALAPALCQVVRMLDGRRDAGEERGGIGYRYARPMDRVMHCVSSDDARMHLRGLYALYDSEYRYEGRA